MVVFPYALHSLIHTYPRVDVKELGEKGIRCLAVAKTNDAGLFSYTQQSLEP